MVWCFRACSHFVKDTDISFGCHPLLKFDVMSLLPQAFYVLFWIIFRLSTHKQSTGLCDYSMVR